MYLDSRRGSEDPDALRKVGGECGYLRRRLVGLPNVSNCMRGAQYLQ